MKNAVALSEVCCKVMLEKYQSFQYVAKEVLENTG